MTNLSSLLAIAMAAAPLMLAQTPPAATPPTVKSVTVEEVVLDLVVRDKKGKPVTDLDPGDLTVSDNGTKQTLTSFRLVRGKEAVSAKGSATALDPLRQLRLVTLAFDALNAPDQRKTARTGCARLGEDRTGNERVLFRCRHQHQVACPAAIHE